MSQGLNRVLFLGYLGADPELRVTQGGQPVLNMRIGCSESYLDKDKVRRERTEWVNVVTWGKRADALAKILRKGSRIFVEGSLRTSSYDDRDGIKRYKTEVNASEIILCGESRGGTSGEDAGDHQGAGRDERRSSGGGHARQGGGRQAPAASAAPAADDYLDYGGGGAGGGDDDIPFASCAPEYDVITRWLG